MTNSNKYKYKPETFTNEDDISYYLLGVFITDGNVSYNTSHSINKKYYSCEVKSADHEWLKTIADMVGENLILTKANNSNCLRLRIHNTKIGEWLISKNCIPNKTLVVKFPTIPDKYLPDFIRGCWDGDGSLSLSIKKNGYLMPNIALYSASENFIFSFKEILKAKINIDSSIYKSKMEDHLMSNGTIITARNQLYVMRITRASSKMFLEKIYYSNNRLAMPRKETKSNSIIHCFNNKTEIIRKKTIKNTDYYYPRKNTSSTSVKWLNDIELVDLINQSNVERVSKLLGIKKQAIWRRLENRKIINLIKKRQRVKLPDKEVLIEMYKLYTYADMAKQLNTTTTTLRKKMKQIGL